VLLGLTIGLLIASVLVLATQWGVKAVRRFDRRRRKA
jgi:hypothetical protein